MTLTAAGFLSVAVAMKIALFNDWAAVTGSAVTPPELKAFFEVFVETLFAD